MPFIEVKSIRDVFTPEQTQTYTSTHNRRRPSRGGRSLLASKKNYISIYLAKTTISLQSHPRPTRPFFLKNMYTVNT